MQRLSNIKDTSFHSVIKINLPENEKKRLEALGLIPKTKICLTLTAPSGEPKAYLIRGAQIALRRDVTDNIWVSSNY